MAGRTAGTLHAWRARRRAARGYADLLALPDYMLRDIGLSRHDIHLSIDDLRTGRRAGK
jgi:uncharacterized protein YjiS (DUF1127 family)